MARGRPRLSGAQTRAADYLQEATVPLHDETHGGEDVGIWASGPGARAFHGEFEQNAIFHLIVCSRRRACAPRSANSAPAIRAACR